jgi:hypothetical protein
MTKTRHATSTMSHSQVAAQPCWAWMQITLLQPTRLAFYPTNVECYACFEHSIDINDTWKKRAPVRAVRPRRGKLLQSGVCGAAYRDPGQVASRLISIHPSTSLRKLRYAQDTRSALVGSIDARLGARRLEGTHPLKLTR